MIERVNDIFFNIIVLGDLNVNFFNFIFIYEIYIIMNLNNLINIIYIFIRIIEYICILIDFIFVSKNIKIYDLGIISYIFSDYKVIYIYI